MKDSLPPAAPARTIEALLKLHDEAFVVKAYEVILGRAPDPRGLNNYLTQVRAGNDKVRILDELVQSPEGRMKSRAGPGLGEAIVEYRKQAGSFWGRLYRGLTGTANEPIERHLRVIDNRLYLVEQDLAQQTAQLAELRILVLQMLANSASASDTEQPAHGPSITETSPSVARTFAELKTAIAMKRIK
jgi:Domain of unknown function (DUF4214)